MHTTRTFTSIVRRSALVALLAALSLGAGLAHAQSFGDSIPRELAEALLANQPAEEMSFGSGWPDGIPELPLPEGVTVLGHLTQNRARVRLALGAEAPLGLRRQQILSALEENGYSLVTPPPRPHPDQRGFVDAVGYPDQMPVQLCSDQHGMLHVGIAAQALVLTAQRIPAQVDCGEMRERFQHRGNPNRSTPGLGEYLPRLELPAGTSSRQSPFARLGISSTSGQAETHGEATTELSLEQLHRHLVEQLPSQGWSADGEFTGSVQAVSSWTRTADEMALLGTLEVVATSTEGPAHVYRLRFAVQSL